jgi:hypothetical protein
MANSDDYKLPISRPQGGTKLDTTWPDGVGVPSDDAPVLPSRQPIATPNLPPRKRK